MESYTNLRSKIKENYLQNIILRFDFVDLVNYEETTNKEITQYLQESGYEKNNAILNEFNVKLNTEEITLGVDGDIDRFELDTTQKRFFVFKNSDKKINIEISPSFIVINKLGNFEKDKYEGFEYFNNLLTNLYKILKKNEKITERRIGVRKINMYQKDSISEFFTYFNNFIISDIKQFHAQEQLTNYAKMFLFKNKIFNDTIEPVEETVGTNYQVKINKGTVVSDKASEKFQLLIDIDTSTDNKNLISNNFAILLQKMNEIIFNLYMASYNKETIDEYIIENKRIW